MKNFSKCGKEEALARKNEKAEKRWIESLPVQLQRELEQSGIVGRGRLPGLARRSRARIAQLVDGGDVGSVVEIEAFSDQLKPQALAYGNFPREPQIELEKARCDEAGPATGHRS